MPDLAQQFSDEEKAHLNYLGSMLRVDPSDEEEEQQRIVNAFDKEREQDCNHPDTSAGNPSQALKMLQSL
jgi:hypothetical protein